MAQAFAEPESSFDSRGRPTAEDVNLTAISEPVVSQILTFLWTNGNAHG
jgi:hypothetical protein